MKRFFSILVLALVVILASQAEANPFWKRKLKIQHCRLIGISKTRQYKPVTQAQVKRELRRQARWQQQVQINFIPYQ
ncbi:MAG: hypothetical protein MUF42_14005 [Cytophagaceae bacterium]|nr:hypothetical protein [Cytophagaceae bacterium]